MNEQEMRVLLITAALSGLSGHMLAHKNPQQLAEWALDSAEHTLQQMKLRGLVTFQKAPVSEGNHVPKGVSQHG